MNDTDLVINKPSEISPNPALTPLIKLKPKQRLAIDNWLKPDSDTFGNLYRSCIKAGFKPSYALNVTHLKPQWLSDTIERTQLNTEHIKQGVQQLATNPNVNSRSPADTNLKAYELLGKYAGMEQQTTTHITVVQPILGGASMHPSHTAPKHVDNIQHNSSEQPSQDLTQPDQ